MTYYKLVREVSEHYELGTDLSNKPWIRSFAVVNTEYGKTIVARKLDTEYFGNEADLLEAIEWDEETNADLQREVADKYPELAKMSTVKTVSRGRLVVDGAFLSAVKEAVAKCQSFGEFAFASRKAFRKETIERLGGNDRELRDFIRWALQSW